MKTSVLWRKGDRRLTEEGWKIWDHSVAFWASPVAQMVKNPPSVLEPRVWSLGQEDLLRREMTSYSSILAEIISWTEEPGRLKFMGSQKSGTWLTDTHTHTHNSIPGFQATLFFQLASICEARMSPSVCPASSGMSRCTKNASLPQIFLTASLFTVSHSAFHLSFLALIPITYSSVFLCFSLGF